MKAAMLLPLALMAPLAHAQGINFSNGSAVGTSLNVSTLTTGTVLNVNAASISADGRYVTMSLQPTSSSLDGIDTFGIGSGTPGLLGGNRAIGIRRLPFRPAETGSVTVVALDKTLLATPVPAMKLDKVGFREAVRKISAATRTNVVIGTAAFKKAQIDDQAPVTLDLPAQSLKEDLVALLGAVAPKTPMVLTAEDKVAFLTTRAQADTDVVRNKVYYLEDLLANIPRYVPSETDLNALDAKAHAVDLDPTRFVLDVSPSAAAAPKPRNLSTNILEVITSTVRPEIWKVNGGKYGEISQVGNRVFITAPKCVHALLEGPSHYNPNKVPLYINYGTR